MTVRDDDVAHGMTVSAFASVSAEPATILISIDTASRTAQMISRTRRLAINILSAGQAAISNRFAGRDGVADRFAGIDHRYGALGLPLIAGAVANLECEVAEEILSSDHTVFFSRVHALHLEKEIDPLLYFHGDYRTIVYGRRRTGRR